VHQQKTELKQPFSMRVIGQDTIGCRRHSQPLFNRLRMTNVVQSLQLAGVVVVLLAGQVQVLLVALPKSREMVKSLHLYARRKVGMARQGRRR